jgi:tetratricopeptide (TPR) repeat protein
MRISWLSPDEIAAARKALTAGGSTYEEHFTPAFAAPPPPSEPQLLDWPGVTEHVARAERVSQVVREQGLAAARERFDGSGLAIEAATLAAAAHEDESLDRDRVLGVLRCPIDVYVFYAPFLELLVSLSNGDLEVAVKAYEEFADAYAQALTAIPHGAARIGAMRDGLADLLVTAGQLDRAEAMFERRHEEDHRDVAVALSASRAYLAAGSVSRAMRWLGIGAARATELGRAELAGKLLQKQEALRKRLS